MSRRHPRSVLNVDDARVNAVLVILGITLADALAAFVTNTGNQVRRDDPSMARLRARVTLGLRELRARGEELSYPDIARLVGAPNHSTVVGRCQQARRLGLITESELRTLRNGGAPTHTPANPAGAHA